LPDVIHRWFPFGKLTADVQTSSEGIDQWMVNVILLEDDDLKEKVIE
jgi:hypothetical protein